MGVGTIEQFREGLAILHDAWADNGRSGRPRAMAMAYFALGAGGRAAAKHDLHHYYGWLGPDVAAGITAGALTDSAAVVDWLGAHAEAGAQEVLLMPCSPELDQVDLLAAALSDRAAGDPVADPADRSRRPTCPDPSVLAPRAG